MSFIDDMLNPQIKKEAMESQGTDKQDHYERKVLAHDWIKGISDLDPVQVEAEYQAKLKEEAMVLGKTAAMDDVIADGVTPEEVVNKDYKRDVVSLSDYALAEMLAEARGHEKQYTSEMFYELKEKAKAEVASSREKAEKALLDLIPNHTMLDWQKAFKAFTKDAVPAEAKEKDLFRTDVPEKAHDFEHPTEEKFKVPADQDKAIPGNGREADERTDATKEAGVLQDDITKGLGKDASLKVKANELDDKIFKVLVDNMDLFNHQGDQTKATEYINELALALSAALQPKADEHIEGLATAEKKADGSCSAGDMIIGGANGLKCMNCGAEKGSDGTVKHQEKKADGPSASDNCPTCGRFAGPTWVSSTELMDVNRPPATPESLNDLEATKKKGDPKPTGKCDECGTKIENYDGTQYICRQCALSYFGGPKSQRKASQDGAPCPECGKILFFDDEMERHLIRRHNWKPIRTGETVRQMKGLIEMPWPPHKEASKECADCHGHFEGAEGDNCPVCDGQGTDLANGMEDNMACQGCGITYGSFKVAETDSHKLKRLRLRVKELSPIKDKQEYVGLLDDVDKLQQKKDEIKSHASKADVIKKIAELNKTAEVQSPWAVTTDEQGNEHIARIDNTATTTKESEEVKPDEILK